MKDIRKPAETRQPGIDATFRNGTMTAVGIVLGFSLGFITTWATAPGAWRQADVLAVIPLLLGVFLQTMSLALLLQPSCLEFPNYRRAMAIFLAGLIATALGVSIGILLDILGVSHLSTH